MNINKSINMNDHQHHSTWDPGALEDPKNDSSMQWETVAYNKWGKRIKGINVPINNENTSLKKSSIKPNKDTIQNNKPLSIKEGHQKEDDPRDKKRRREGHTNETPPPKRTTGPQKPKTKKKFLYAEIAKEAFEIVIVRKNGDHISLQEWNKFIKILDTDYVRCLSAVNEFLPNYEGRKYTNKRAIIYVNDEASSQYVHKIVKNCTPLLSTSWSEAERMREERRDKQRLTGFIRGVTGNIGDEVLKKIIAHQCTLSGIQGSVEIVRSELTQLGKVLHICLDKTSFEGLQSMDFTIKIASAGKVRFQDPRKAPTLEECEETKDLEIIEETEGGKEEINSELQTQQGKDYDNSKRQQHGTEEKEGPEELRDDTDPKDPKTPDTQTGTPSTDTKNPVSGTSAKKTATKKQSKIDKFFESTAEIMFPQKPNQSS